MFCFIDYRTSKKEIDTLQTLGFTCITIPKSNSLYPAIDGHVDIQLAVLDKCKKEVIIHKNMDENFKNLLVSKGIFFQETASSLNSTYPENIILNSLILKNHFIHNLSYTDSVLLKTQNSKKLINVKQGYTKCSCLPINENAIITSDVGIYKKLTDNGFDMLLLPPGDIELPGLAYGFIGGTGGMINKNTLALFGNLANYKYGNEVLEFLNKYNVKPIFLKDGKLTDRGSLLTFCDY